MESAAQLIAQGARVLAAGAFLLALIVAVTHWAVRRGTIAAFGAWARTVRRLSDPIVRHTERRVHRSGGNPQDAPWWLVAAVVVAGLLLIAAVDWILNFVLNLTASVQYGHSTPVLLLVDTLFNILMGALFIRVISSWLGISPYARWMRPIVILTDWLLAPIQRLLPSFGGIDFSPMVAYFLLYFVKNLLLRSLMGG